MITMVTNGINFVNFRRTFIFLGPSKKKIRIGRTKYKFPKEKATFEEAKSICAKDDMDLTAFDNPEEINRISEYLNYIGNVI
jgi:hypothetical protein